MSEIENDCGYDHSCGCSEKIDALKQELSQARADAETQRMRLAACGVAALSNTDKTRAERITKENPYYSASYGDVCYSVDSEMALRSRLELVERVVEAARRMQPATTKAVDATLAAYDAAKEGANG